MANSEDVVKKESAASLKSEPVQDTKETICEANKFVRIVFALKLAEYCFCLGITLIFLLDAGSYRHVQQNSWILWVSVCLLLLLVCLIYVNMFMWHFRRLDFWLGLGLHISVTVVLAMFGGYWTGIRSEMSLFYPAWLICSLSTLFILIFACQGACRFYGYAGMGFVLACYLVFSVVTLAAPLGREYSKPPTTTLGPNQTRSTEDHRASHYSPSIIYEVSIEAKILAVIYAFFGILSMVAGTQQAILRENISHCRQDYMSLLLRTYFNPIAIFWFLINLNAKPITLAE